MAVRLRKGVGGEPGCACQQHHAAPLIDRQRMRVGDYRIIFEKTKTEIIVTAIAPRGGAYR